VVRPSQFLERDLFHSEKKPTENPENTYIEPTHRILSHDHGAGDDQNPFEAPNSPLYNNVFTDYQPEKPVSSQQPHQQY
jgi:hypothetical protein